MRKVECNVAECPFCGQTVCIGAEIIERGRTVTFWYNLRSHYFEYTVVACTECIRSMMVEGYTTNNQGEKVMADKSTKEKLLGILLLKELPLHKKGETQIK